MIEHDRGEIRAEFRSELLALGHGSKIVVLHFAPKLDQKQTVKTCINKVLKKSFDHSKS